MQKLNQLLHSFCYFSEAKHDYGGSANIVTMQGEAITPTFIDLKINGGKGPCHTSILCIDIDHRRLGLSRRTNLTQLGEK
jgi:hypothetical protein